MASLVWLALPKGRRTATVIFLHGLDGHAYDTWRRARKDVPWPIWLAQDIEGVAVATVSYAARSTGWTGYSMSLDERAKSLFPLVVGAAAAAGEPVIFVCHSLGGLIVKRIITMAASGQHFQGQGDAFVKRVKGVVFYATPHGGAGYGDLADWLRFIVWPTPTMSYLTRRSSEVATLNEAYRNWAIDAPVRHLIIYETRPTLYGWIVRAREADPGIPHAPLQPAEADHFRVCKPFDKSDQRYTLTRDFVSSIVRQSTDPSVLTHELSGAPTIPDPLPELPRGEPIIIPHLVLRFLIVATIVYVCYRGAVAIYADPFQLQIQQALKQSGASTAQQADLSRKILDDAERRQIGGETVANILKRNGLPVASDPITLYENTVALLKRYSEIQERNHPLRVSRDEEVRSFSSSANQALQAGDIGRADILTQAAELRAKLTSQVKFSPVAGSRVAITNGWDRENVVSVRVPQLNAITGGSAQSGVQFYRGGAEQLKAAFAEIETAGLSSQVKEWCGSYSPRLERGSRVLSTHALGIAFDINCSSLPYGLENDLSARPPFAKLISIFQKHGFVWGGQFNSPDPMHFQLFRIDAPNGQ
jgi:hypothetical protein